MSSRAYLNAGDEVRTTDTHRTGRIVEVIDVAHAAVVQWGSGQESWYPTSLLQKVGQTPDQWLRELMARRRLKKNPSGSVVYEKVDAGQRSS